MQALNAMLNEDALSPRTNTSPLPRLLTIRESGAIFTLSGGGLWLGENCKIAIYPSTEEVWIQEGDSYMGNDRLDGDFYDDTSSEIRNMLKQWFEIDNPNIQFPHSNRGIIIMNVTNEVSGGEHRPED